VSRRDGSLSERLAVLHQVRVVVAADVRHQITTMVTEGWPVHVAAAAVVVWWTSEIESSARHGAMLGLRDHEDDEAVRLGT
jgi:hypothetical protein